MLEQQILAGILFNEEFTRKVLPFTKDIYFREPAQRILIGLIQRYVDKYNALPGVRTLAIELSTLHNLTQAEFDESKALLQELSAIDPTELKIPWLLDQTEKFFQERAVYNAIMDSVGILEDPKHAMDKGAIPKLLQDALGVNFDNAVGHDYIEDSNERFDFYHKVEDRIKFDLEYFNRITGGGLPRKTLTVALAGTGVGKTLAMCHFAAANLMDGKNVLYITMEMAQERISQRIDCNLLNLSMDELMMLPKDDFQRKFGKLRNRVSGRLIVKEYPTASAGSAHFRHLLNELKLKKNFVPDIIYIDYLNICCSSRLKLGNAVNSYQLIKSIAEEIRGLAQEFNVAIVTATQTNRNGYASSDIEMNDTSESFGLPMTADFMFALMNTNELKQLCQMLVKQLKNRFRDVFLDEKFVIGVDRARFKFYDVEESAQRDILRHSATDSSPSGGVSLNKNDSFGAGKPSSNAAFQGFDFS